MGQSVPLHNYEVVPEGEMEAIHGTNEVFRQFLSQIYAQPQTDTGSGLVIQGTRRGVHPKAHGCLVGQLEVSSKLSRRDQVGIFQESRKYNVLARFSNGSPRPNSHDREADSRGFGLKIVGVDGKYLLNNAVGSEVDTTQEFTMNSSDRFFSDTAETYHRFMQVALLETPDFGTAAKNFVLEMVNIFKLKNPTLGLRILKAFKEIQAVKATNPLAINYFSISPFQHGEGSSAPLVKYSLQPCEGTWEEPVNEENPHFLRENLVKHISSKPACFRFLVQDRYWRDFSSVEDPTQRWDESQSPFREIARVHFPRQRLVDERVCEKEVINPWNTLAAHKPVGGINRMRLGSYLFSILARKKTNPNLQGH
jgi:catalase